MMTRGRFLRSLLAIPAAAIGVRALEGEEVEDAVAPAGVYRHTEDGRYRLYIPGPVGERTNPKTWRTWVTASFDDRRQRFELWP